MSDPTNNASTTRYLWFGLAAFLALGAVYVLITGEFTMAGGARGGTSVVSGWVARLFALGAFGFALLLFSIGTDPSFGQGGTFADLPRRTRMLFVTGGLIGGLFVLAGLIVMVARGPKPDPYAQQRQAPAKVEAPQSTPGHSVEGERPPPP